ncbi:MAG TPA: hydantoinase/oxoprolinase family protein, partial [Natronoarchaeum rubrum]|nr:hydantoinase/oxoprolinase family protein [Natronoarchaeum rubrum]
MHAISIADGLDIDRVVIPRASGVLSAYGLLAADEKRDAVRTFQRSIDEVDPDEVDGVYEELTAQLLAEVSDRERATVTCSADLRYAGQSFELTVDVDRPFDTEEASSRFGDAHESAYGYRADEPVELVNCRVTTTVPRSEPALEYAGGGDPQKGAREAAFADGVHETPVYGREQLAPGETLDGPAIVEGDESTIVVPPAWDVQVREDGALIAEVRDT